MNSDPNRLHRLFAALTDGTITGEEHAELQNRLRGDAAARSQWFRHLDIEDGLYDLVQKSPGVATQAVSKPESATTKSHPGRLRPLLAAAAGLVAGLLCASVAFGFGRAERVKSVTLFHDSFEEGGNPSTRGRPFEPGHWGGDFSEIVNERGDIAPSEGQKMLRFLRADDETAHLPDSRSSDVFQLLDIRPFKNEFSDGSGVVKLSAKFNATSAGAADPIFCCLMLYALDAAIVEESRAADAAPNLRRHSLAFAQSTRVKLDRNAAVWQSASNELRLPPETDFLMIQVGVSNDSKTPGKRIDDFGNHYADAVNVTLARLPEVPLP